MFAIATQKRSTTDDKRFAPVDVGQDERRGKVLEIVGAQHVDAIVVVVDKDDSVANDGANVGHVVIVEQRHGDRRRRLVAAAFVFVKRNQLGPRHARIVMRPRCQQSDVNEIRQTGVNGRRLSPQAKASNVTKSITARSTVSQRRRQTRRHHRATPAAPHNILMMVSFALPVKTTSQQKKCHLTGEFFGCAFKANVALDQVEQRQASLTTGLASRHHDEMWVRHLIS